MMDDDNYLRVLQVLESLDREERTHRWKKIVSFVKRTANRILPNRSVNRAAPDMDAPLPKAGGRAKPRTGSICLSDPQSTSDITALAQASKLRQPAWTFSIALFMLAIIIAATFVNVALHESVLGRMTSFLKKGAVTHLELQVEQHPDGSLLVRWDPNSAKIAKFGVVEIEDGSEHRSLRLDSSQLANGSILYAPATRDLTFRLNAFDGTGKQMSGFMRVVNGSVAPPRSDATELASYRPNPKERSNQSLEKEAPTSANSNTKPSKTVRASSLTRIGPNGDSSLAHGSTAVKSAVFPEGQRGPVTGPRSRNRELLKPAESLLPRQSAPTFALAGTRKNSSESLSEPTNIAARPLKQVAPGPANLGSLSLSRPVEIDVQVTIDDEGHVAEAQVINNPSDEKNVLASAALIAAKQWIFEPAQVHGRRVPSDHRIVFHFRPK